MGCKMFISMFSLREIARLSQSLWTTKPKNFYHHSNQLSTICVVRVLILDQPLSLGVQRTWLNLAISDPS